MNKTIAIAGLIGVTLFGAAARADDVPHLCGGVGVEGRQALRVHAHEYNLGVIVDRSVHRADDFSHVYLSNVVLTVKQDGHEITSFVADGPICYVKLPAGSYTVTGTWDATDRSVNTHTGRMDAQLRW